MSNLQESRGWIGVDLDGTLAHYDNWVGPTHIGAPIPRMVERVKEWRAKGRQVRIFTARVCERPGGEEELKQIRDAIAMWCFEYIGEVLPVTNVKDFAMIELWDDRAVQVIPNTGLRADTIGTV